MNKEVFSLKKIASIMLAVSLICALVGCTSSNQADTSKASVGFIVAVDEEFEEIKNLMSDITVTSLNNLDYYSGTIYFTKIVEISRY